MPSHNWPIPTFKDDPSHDGSDRPVKCPQCGRPVAPDMLLSVQELPGEVSARLRRPQRRWACDSCRSKLYREGVVSPGDHMRFLGAPEQVASGLDQKSEHPAKGRFDQQLTAHRQRNP